MATKKKTAKKYSTINAAIDALDAKKKAPKATPAQQRAGTRAVVSADNTSLLGSFRTSARKTLGGPSID